MRIDTIYYPLDVWPDWLDEFLYGNPLDVLFKSPSVRRRVVTKSSRTIPRRRKTVAKRVFLSFVVEDKSAVEMFRGQAKNKNNDLEFSDYSVQEPYNSSNADYIRGRIKERISAAAVTICLIGETTNKSRWVDWEVQTAVDLKKNVFGVRLYSEKNHTVPDALTRNGKKVYKWVIDDIVAAIG